MDPLNINTQTFLILVFAIEVLFEGEGFRRSSHCGLKMFCVSAFFHYLFNIPPPSPKQTVKWFTLQF